MTASFFIRRVRCARVLIALVAACVLLGAAALQAEEASALTETPATPQAQAAFERGVELADLKRFGDARNEFKASFQMAPSSSALFAWAQAERLAGNCREAEPLYQRFLQSAASSEQQEAARIALRRCETAPALPPPAPTPLPAPPPPSPAPSPKVWPFVATGTALVVAGGIALLVSQLEANAANDAQSYQGYRDARARAQTERIIGWSAAGAGVLTLGVSAWLGQRAREPSPNLALWLPNATAVGAMWMGPF
ncbi:MAG: hypothetical protein SF187_24010 [Deltaproteobacteria bacterium]|nr:hypothetical protein [Deltaproteobacteria bacterium]